MDKIRCALFGGVKPSYTVVRNALKYASLLGLYGISRSGMPNRDGTAPKTAKGQYMFSANRVFIATRPRTTFNSWSTGQSFETRLLTLSDLVKPVLNLVNETWEVLPR